MIHHTVGVYPNGQMKSNGVPSDILQDHIGYNKTWRFGRALFVDGVCVYEGCVSQKVLDESLLKIQAMTKPTKDTRPYN